MKSTANTAAQTSGTSAAARRTASLATASKTATPQKATPQKAPNKRRVERRAAERRTTVRPLVGLIMGSRSDWKTLCRTAETLDMLGVPFEEGVVSAHRTPARLFEYATSAHTRGLEVIIAGAGGAAHLPGMTASMTSLPVLGVPVESRALHGLDSLLSIVQMPAGVPVGTLAIGESGAINAALLATSILANKHPRLRDALERFRQNQTQTVLAHPSPREDGASPPEGAVVVTPELVHDAATAHNTPRLDTVIETAKREAATPKTAAGKIAKRKTTASKASSKKNAGKWPRGRA